ncbi:MFS transporter [Phycicoccus sp. CSK15P-2]|uniref:MFS transporter n=1 Tax=Phycicoccus sp. CSK15P-2 TaxID=2807627 RepID=UPI00194F92E5|nr:MFS transporter [Phycicoccus sp. CSK15P-2]MBM6405033.1 MFS transporter [Phycicoccus sp. CSK15P-2]
MGSASGLTTLGALPPFLLGAQAVWVREDLRVGLGVFGAAVSAFFAAAAVGSVLAGVLFDRAGRRTGLVAAGALVATGGLGMAGVVSGAALLVPTMVVLGLGNACCQTAANTSMARALPPGRRGLGFGVKQSAVPVAIMLGGLAVPTVGGWLGWRSTFVVTAAVGVVVAVGALLRPLPEVRAAAPEGGLPDRPPWPPLVLAGVAITFASAAANFLGAFVASWAAVVGMGPTAAGVLMACGSAGSVAVRILSGWRADGRHGGNLPVVAVQMFSGAVCFAGLALGAPWAVVVFGFLAFAVGWAWPGLLLFAVARVGRDSPARSSGVIQAGAFVGGATGPALFGSMAGAVGFERTWLAAGSCFVVAGVLVLVSRRGFAADLLSRPPREPLTWGGGRIREGEPGRRG